MPASEGPPGAIGRIEPVAAAPNAPADASVMTPDGVGAVKPEDALLECLEIICRHHGRPRSGEVLMAGLPLAGPRVTPTIFVRAAERAGFRARVVKRRINRISRYVLPAVLAFKDGRACVLLDYDQGGTARVVLPETGGNAETVELTQLAAEYSGYAIFVRPEVQIDAARGEESIPKPRAWFWGTLVRNWWTYIQVAVAAVLINLFALITPLFIMTVYDRVIPNNAFETLYVLAIGAGAALTFDFLMKGLRGYFIDSAGKKADVMLACRIFDQVLDMRMSERPGSAGAFANTLREFETLRDFFTSATLATLVDLPFVLLFIAVIWLISGPVAIVLAVAVPVVLIFGLLIQIPLNFVVKRNFRESHHKHGILVETINGLETIKSIGAEGRMRHLWEGLVGLSARSSQRARALSLSAVNFSGLIQQLASVGVVIYGVHLVAAGDLTVGALIACVILGGRAIAPLGQVAQLLTRFHQSMASLAALDRIMKAPVERPPEKTFLHRAAVDGRVDFREVGFTYPGRDQGALKEVTFGVAPGEHVGIIGKVGSGKSTIARLILGLFEPAEGTILIDGTDIRQLDPVDLRRHIGYVPQDPFLFRGTIRENITAAAPHADDAAILAAARLAGLDEFLSDSPLGFDLPVGERGDGISGGQRQAITLARAALLNPTVYVLDEPTSAMDTRSEETLKRRLTRVIAGKTLILMTHRASLLGLVDRLIVLDGGKVMADGPRERVLEALASGRIGAARPSEATS